MSDPERQEEKNEVIANRFHTVYFKREIYQQQTRFLQKTLFGEIQMFLQN